MTNWLQLVRRALVSGSSAGVVSLLALVAGGRRDCRSAFAPVNAVSHWIWRDRALHQQAPSLRYTVPGYGIHHSMSILWALAYEERLARARPPAPLRAVATGLAVSAAACFVDLKLTPKRLTPGFERRLGPASLSAVYLAFGLGLALPAAFAALRRAGAAGKRRATDAVALPPVGAQAADAAPAGVPGAAAAPAIEDVTAAVRGAACADAAPAAWDEEPDSWNRSTTSRLS